MELFLRFCESEIGYWATRYIETQRKSDQRKEQKVIDLKCEVREHGLTRKKLYQVGKWKSPRRVKLTLDPANTDDRIKRITQQAFSIKDHWLKLEKLTYLGASDRQELRRSCTYMMKKRIRSLIDTPFILWGGKGKQGPSIQSCFGGSMYVFAEILRNGTVLACEPLIGLYGLTVT